MADPQVLLSRRRAGDTFTKTLRTTQHLWEIPAHHATPFVDPFLDYPLECYAIGVRMLIPVRVPVQGGIVRTTIPLLPTCQQKD